MEWDKKLSELEMRALCNFVLDKENGCKVVADKEDPFYNDEGLRQTLYLYEKSNEYVFIERQRGYITNAFHLNEDEVEKFRMLWEESMPNTYDRPIDNQMTK